MLAMLHIGKNRKALEPIFSDGAGRVALEDIAMLMEENVYIGLRTRWVRRVAVPMTRAYLALHAEGQSDAQRASTAKEILDQCDDDALAVASVNWINTVFLAPKETTP
jgi:hypothetical protein